MPTVEKLSIALPEEMAAMIRSAVDRGEYSSNSEVIRDALRDWTYKRSLRERGLADIRSQWLAAVADDSEEEVSVVSGSGVSSGAVVMPSA